MQLDFISNVICFYELNVKSNKMHQKWTEKKVLVLITKHVIMVYMLYLLSSLSFGILFETRLNREIVSLSSCGLFKQNF